MRTGTFLQTFALLAPLVSSGGLLEATLARIHPHWVGQFPLLDVGLCA